MQVGTRQKFYCNRCKQVTHHQLHSVHERNDEEVAYEGTSMAHVVFWETDEYRLWICCGCDAGLLESAYTNMGMSDETGDQFFNSELSPKPQRTSLTPKRFLKLSDKLGAVYREVIEAYNAELSILCSVGLRALLEGICTDKSVEDNNLHDRISGLKESLPDNIVDHLHSLRFIGNEAAHELEPASKQDLRMAIDIMEDILNFLYDLEYKTSRLPRKTVSAT